MKRYAVMITPTAEADAVEAFEYIRARSPVNAARRLRGLYESIEKLEMLAGVGRAMESDLLGVELRQLVYKSHRVLFSVDEKRGQVTVHYIRHGARRRLGEEFEQSEQS